MARTKYNVRTREEILAGVTVVSGHVWATCGNCGGQGTYPSSMLPAGMCRFYCWQNRTPETYGKMPVPVDTYVKRVQAAERREQKRAAEWAAGAAQRAEKAQLRADRIANPDPRIARAAEVFGFKVEDAEYGTFAGEMVGRWVGTGHLTEGQWNALVKATEEKAAKDAQRAASGHIGQVGQRLEVDVTVEAVRDFSRRVYGTLEPRYLVRMRAQDGNLLVWWANTHGHGAVAGEKATVKVTVKEHGEYQGEKQTVVQRCVFVGDAS